MESTNFIFMNNKIIIKLIFAGIFFTKSQRGRSILNLDGYTYNDRSSSRSLWYCTNYYNYPQCKASVRLVSTAPYEIIVMGEHNHNPPAKKNRIIRY